MKKVILALVVLLCASGIAFAAGATVSDASGPFFDKGTLAANLGIGYGGVSGGVEYEFVRFDVADKYPLTIGAALRAAVDPGIFGDAWASLTTGVGALATAHFSWNSVFPDLPFVSKLDSYVGLGLGLGFAALGSAYTGSDFASKPGIGIATCEGVSYRLNSKLAVGFEYGYLGTAGYTYTNGDVWSYSESIYYSTIGLTFKF